MYLSQNRLAMVICIAAALLSGGGAEAADRPLAALQQPAVKTPSAFHSAMLTVARAGNRLVAGGERGVILLSDDNGSTWQQADTPVRVTVTEMVFVNDKLGWAIGHLGVILRTVDGGKTWQKQMDGVQAAALFTKAASNIQDPARAPAAQQYAKLLVDDGPDKPWLGVHFSDMQNGIVVGAYNLAMVTADGGATWRPLSFDLPNSKSLHLYGVAARGAELLIYGEQGLLLRSLDGGATFAAVASPYKGTWFGVLPLANGWLAYGLRGNAFVSNAEDSGWTAVKTGQTASITAALHLSGSRVMLVSQTGELLIGKAGTGTFESRGLSVGAAAADAAEAADGTVIVATLRGMVRVPVNGAAAR